MKSNGLSLLRSLVVLIFVSGCAGLQVGQDVQAGRIALQTGRPEIALGYLRRAAERDPNYTTPYTPRESVLTYLGRAYYETGNFAEARSTLEKELARDKDDYLARLYLGLTLMRAGDQNRGRREAEDGLKGIHDWLENISTRSESGLFWDPARQIRSDIDKTLAAKLETSEFIATAQRIGSEFDEEVDRARKDETYTRYNRTGGGGD
ncbi:MAG: tetratricopeptide repeat protein [Candidatus Binatia bacterium]|jgi:tetratricopeptide (TPR) repeat protein